MANPKLPEAREVILIEYNKIRRKAGLPNILASDKMNEDAQQHADYLVKEGKFETTTMGKYACNIATAVEARLFDGVKDTVARLHKMKEKQHYLKEGCNKMGMGIARNEEQKKWVIVMFYEVPKLSKEQPTAKSMRSIFTNAKSI